MSEYKLTSEILNNHRLKPVGSEVAAEAAFLKGAPLALFGYILSAWKAEVWNQRETINLSAANIWDKTKLEWNLHTIYEAEEPETCLCGHFPIKEICVLRNKVNGNLAVVGNCCVKKFIGLPSDKIFQAVKRVRKNDEKSLNAEAISHAFEKGWINQWEFNFSIDTMRKRNLSIKQLQTRKKINAKMLNNMRRVSN